MCAGKGANPGVCAGRDAVGHAFRWWTWVRPLTCHIIPGWVFDIRGGHAQGKKQQEAAGIPVPSPVSGKRPIIGLFFLSVPSFLYIKHLHFSFFVYHCLEILSRLPAKLVEDSSQLCDCFDAFFNPFIDYSSNFHSLLTTFMFLFHQF